MARTDTLGNFLTDVANAIRTKKGTEETILASDFDTEIENLPSGAEGIYMAQSVEEMNEIPNPNKSDICFLYHPGPRPSTIDDTFDKLVIPPVVNSRLIVGLNNTARFENSDGSEYIEISSGFLGAQPKIVIVDSSHNTTTINYKVLNNVSTRSDGVSTNQTFTFSSGVSIVNASRQYYNNSIGKFLLMEDKIGDGVYDYNGIEWVYCNFNTDVDATDIYKNKKAYTTNGMITGTFGTLSESTDLKKIVQFIGELDTSNLTSFHWTFGYPNPASLSYFVLLPMLNTSSATDMSQMFYGVDGSGVTSLDLRHFDTSNVTTMYGMFDNSDFTNIDVSSFNTSNVTDMHYMFADTNFTELDLSSFETPKVTDMNHMFDGCTNLTKLDIRKFTFDAVTKSDYMFGRDNNPRPKMPANCEIIVKSSTEKQWINTNFSWLTNVKTVAEYEAS